MTHHRQRIRQEFAREIQVATAGLVKSVVASAYLPARGLPTICVYVESEAAVFQNSRLERVVTVVAKVIVAAATNADDLLDDICAEIESAVDPKLDGLADDGKLSSTRFEIEQDEKATWQIMSALLSYRFLYATSATIAGTAL